ncbi:MAG TPA: hypothetical protein VGO37_20295 [Steroidobacteraceae bacterium]|nr:hypothetical protein [Steroidobacteraceae bacterium]
MVFREGTEKVTIALSKRSVDSFKKEVRLHGTQYQRMIRALLDRYADAAISARRLSGFGEDYLYPAQRFVAADLPVSTRRAVLRVA